MNLEHVGAGVFVLCLLIIVAMRDNTRRCNIKTVEFSEVMHVPVLKTAKEKKYKESLNDISVNMPRNQKRHALNDLMSPRWNGGQVSHPMTNDRGRREDGFAEQVANPGRHLSRQNNSVLKQTAGMNAMRRESHMEPLSDDLWK